jgi:uncharacterized protein YijF (DUF1287 family)
MTTAHTRRSALALLASAPALPALAARPRTGADLVAAARRQIGVTKGYDPAYRKLAYPGGDVPRSTGVCADVIVRAARDAWGLDLQRLVHEDMQLHFKAYPKRWGLPAPDANIDHRRVPNLETYWTRQGARIWQSDSHSWGSDFHGPLEPGDLLTWRSFVGGGPHVAIVAEGGGWPRIVQNFGWGAREDLLLLAWLNTAHAHFRWLPRV